MKPTEVEEVREQVTITEEITKEGKPTKVTKKKQIKRKGKQQQVTEVVTIEEQGQGSSYNCHWRSNRRSSRRNTEKLYQHLNMLNHQKSRSFVNKSLWPKKLQKKVNQRKNN